MNEFEEMIGELLTRNYGSAFDHAFMCDTDNGDWQNCIHKQAHADAGVDISLRVMVAKECDD